MSASEPNRQMTMRRTFSQTSASAEERVKAAVVQTAFARGMWGALYGGLAGGLGMFFANKHNFMGMRTMLGISGKTGLIVTAAVTPFWLRGEMTLVEAQQHPERFVTGAYVANAADPVHHGPRPLALWQRALNYVYENPVSTWATLVVPAYAGIFAFESYSPATAHMVLSQRVIHTRVYGQFVAISTLLVIGLTTDTMRKAGGPFVVHDDEADSEGGGDAPTASQRAAAQPTGGVKWSLLVPLLYAPLLPLLRIGLRNRVTKRQLDLVTGGAIALALTHAGVIMFSDSTVLG